MSGVPRGVTARRFIGALHSDGFLLARTRGSHHIRLSDALPVGTLKAMIEAAEWMEGDLARLLMLANYSDGQLGPCGAGILPAAGFQPAWPPEKAAAAKIGRPTSALWQVTHLSPEWSLYYEAQ